ncbi:MAG: di-trans,poly-cis-decaprenylcistransferase [Nanoarchaeota archaeon]|nr:di-trans,poly-cis-decaprenylcistransferase [Nanoarchaeota archaeon]MBU1135238.1 di-trans,poly-cis-decaprenylcistransferase [Nanoarchaeota archaeon]MBU2519912.1 di-trans,poly-cis-decaprenylcistransferase [Nanoarchaeota archaeon]
MKGVNTMIKNAPKHVGIIPDGNRRFAKRLLQNPWKGHEWGSEKMHNVFQWCKECGIKHMTFYALSKENLKSRPKKELDFLLKMAGKEIKDILQDKKHFVHKDKVKVTFFGKLDLLPKDLQLDMHRAMKMTKKYKKYTLNLAVAYGGRQEIVDMCKSIARKVATGKLKPERVTEAVIKQNLYTNGVPDPDLIIRTSENRLSGFLLWQSAYAEFAFIDTLWPELTKKQFVTAVKSYADRERRFGK